MSGPVRIRFLGHSTVLLELGGVRLLTDPILRRRVGPLVHANALPEAHVPDDVTAVLISHSHWDHLDIGSLRMLGTATPILVPRGLGGRIRGRGFREVIELLPGEATRVGEVGIRAVPAHHRGLPRPLAPPAPAIGYVLDAGPRVYFPGDTALFAGMETLAPDLDLALMPVWGWGPRARSSEHLDPLGAAQALRLLRPRVAIPIHWGTLHPLGFRWLRPSTRTDPPHAFARLAAEHAPETEVRVLAIGERTAIEPAAAAPPAPSVAR
ncbi:MAG: MBL fold metallo-hydrolase [Chloroflexota bacterium]